MLMDINTSSDNALRFILMGTNYQRMRSVRDRPHRFGAVHDQIDDHLLKLDPIPPDRRQRRCKLQTRGYLLNRQFVLQQGHHLINGIVDVERHLLGVGFFQQAADPLDHLARPVAILDDPFHRAADVVEVRCFAAKKAQARLAIGDDRRERLIHFMGDRGAYFTKRRHPAGVSQGGLRGL